MEQTGKRKEILWFYVRILVWIAALVALFSMAANLPVLAAEEVTTPDSKEEDFVIKDGVLTEYQGSEEVVVIPEGVTEIGRKAFYKNEKIHSVTLPEGVTKINSAAFMYCTNLETIVFPATLKEMEHHAFCYCQKLQEAILSEGVEIVGDSAFDGCDELKTVELPDTLREIGLKAFSGCFKLEKIIIPKQVTKIGRGAFWACESLTEIQIPATVTDPGGKTTYQLTPWLEEQLAALPEESPFLIVNQVLIATRTDLETAVTVPDGVKRIAYHAFHGTNFTSVTVSDSVTEIGDAVFGDCYKLEKVYMPDSVKKLGSDTFYNCKALKTVRFSNSLKVLEYPFDNCTQLEQIELPLKLENLIGETFLRCKKLKKVIVHSKLKQERACCLPNGTDITAKNVSPKIVIYVDKGSPAEKYLRSLKGEKKIAYAYNKKSTDSSGSSSYQTYTVKKGDSLWNIAKKYLGSGSRYPEIVTLNKLGKKGIQAGQKLKIPKK